MKQQFGIFAKTIAIFGAFGFVAFVGFNAEAHVVHKHKSKNCRHLVRHYHTPTIVPPHHGYTPPTEHPLPPRPDQCRASELQGLVGQDRRVLQTMRFGQTVRIEEPGMMYTQEYSPDRLRIIIGENGKIIMVVCG